MPVYSQVLYHVAESNRAMWNKWTCPRFDTPTQHTHPVYFKSSSKMAL